MSRHHGAAQRGHEHSDVAVGPIAKAALVLALGTGAVMALMAGLLHWSAPAAEPAARPPAGSGPSFPEPRLQTDPAADLARQRAWEEDVLQRYGWVDRERGLVRMPLDAALEIVGRRGLAAAEQQIRAEGN